MNHSSFYSELITFGLNRILLIVLLIVFNLVITKFLKLIIKIYCKKMGLADLKLSRLDFRPILCKLSIQELELSLEKHFKMKVRIEQLNLKLNLNCLWKRSGMQNASNPTLYTPPVATTD